MAFQQKFRHIRMPLCNQPKSNGKLQITIFISSPQNISTYYVLACHKALHEVFTTYEVRGNSQKEKRRDKLLSVRGVPVSHARIKEHHLWVSRQWRALHKGWEWREWTGGVFSSLVWNLFTVWISAMPSFLYMHTIAFCGFDHIKLHITSTSHKLLKT